jgi:hypothetical protein
MLIYEIEASLAKAEDYEGEGYDAMAAECRSFAEKAGGTLTVLSG